MVRVDIDGIKCDYLSQGTWKFGELEFSSEICSGNIAAVEQLDDAGTRQGTDFRVELEKAKHSITEMANNHTLIIQGWAFDLIITPPGSMPGRNSVAAMAIAMPIIPSVLPWRAVTGLESPRSVRMKKMPAMM